MSTTDLARLRTHLTESRAQEKRAEKIMLQARESLERAQIKSRALLARISELENVKP